MISITSFSGAADEARAIQQLIVGIQRDEFAIPISLEDQPDLQQIPAVYQVKNGNFWIAKHDGRVVGTIALLDIGENQVALRKMFVAPEYRGSSLGTARKLLEAALKWSATQGVRQIFLGTTSAFLAAHRFYEKHGFKEIPREALPAAFPVMSVDSKFYRFDLEQQI